MLFRPWLAYQYGNVIMLNYCFLRLSMCKKMPAMMVPLMECQAQEMAQGSTESGWAAKKVPASTVARPAFCIPTSIDKVRFFAMLNRASRPAVQPSRYPREL